jgi:hypothetical protein
VPYILLYSYLRIIYLLPHACNPNTEKMARVQMKVALKTSISNAHSSTA